MVDVLAKQGGRESHSLGVVFLVMFLLLCRLGYNGLIPRSQSLLGFSLLIWGGSYFLLGCLFSWGFKFLFAVIDKKKKKEQKCRKTSQKILYMVSLLRQLAFTWLNQSNDIPFAIMNDQRQL